jgi:hypothetical protein
MSKAGWGVLFLALAAIGAAPTPERAGGKTDGKNIFLQEEYGQMDLLTDTTTQWLKVYPLPIYRERWHLEGTVQSLEQDMPKLRQAFAKVGASLVEIDEGSAKSKARRMAYRCPKEAAKLALQELRGIGAFGEPRVQPILEPVTLPEVQGKIAALQADKNGHAAELSRMPAVSALVEELLGHLRSVEAALRKPQVEVLIELTVKEQG